VITGIVFLCWIYRANHNARQLGAAGMRFSPGFGKQSLKPSQVSLVNATASAAIWRCF